MTDVEDALRARITELEAELATQPFIPALPDEHDGEPITWRPWEPAPVILCTRAGDPNGCSTCNYPGPTLIAFGLSGPDRPRIRYNAHRCPSCQEMRVYHRVYDKYRLGADLQEIAYSPPRTITGDAE